MFAHFNGTRSGFEAKVGNKSNYDDCIVFISGGGTEEPCIYTHGKYYANDTFLKNLDASVKDLNYVKGITVGGKTYDFHSVADGGSYLPFDKTSTATIDASNDGTLHVNVIGLGTKDTTDSSTSDYAWGRIKYLQSQLKNINDNIDGSIGTQIGDFYDTSVAPLVTWKNELAKDASVKDTSNGISVKVTTNGGKVTGVDVDASSFIKVSDLEDTSTLSKSSNGVKVTVSTTGGKVSSVGVDASTFVKTGDVSLSKTTKTSDDDCGVDVTVVTEKGAVLDVSVALDPSIIVTHDWLGEHTDTKSDTSNNIKVSVTTKGGNVTDVSVDAPKFALDSYIEEFYKDGKILVGALPDYILGQVMYGGTIGANGALSLSQGFTSKFTTKPSTLPSDASTYEGVYFIATAAGTSQGVTYAVGDWVISSGVKWEKIDNTDAVSSVAGLTGAITVPSLIEKLDSSIDGIISGWWADTSVGETKLDTDAVTTDKIKDANVTEAKLATNAVTTTKIKDANVTEAKLATNAVTTAKIKDANVTTAKIKDANVTEAKLATNAVTTDKIKDANVTEAKLATNAVTTTKIKDANVTEAKLDDSVKAKLNAAKVTSISSSSDYLTYDTSTGAVTTSLSVGSYEDDTEGLATVDDIKYALSWIEL